MKQEKKNILVTIPLYDVIELCLRGDESNWRTYCAIPEDTACVLEIMLKDSTEFRVIRKLPDGTVLEKPELWIWKFWNDSSIRYYNLKEWDKKFREENERVEINMKRVSIFFQTTCSLDEEHSIKLARKLCKEENLIALETLGFKIANYITKNNET